MEEAPVQFSEFLNERVEKATNVAFSSKDTTEIFRSQGEMKILGDLMTMSAEIRSYLHDVATGKRTKIEPQKPQTKG